MTQNRVSFFPSIFLLPLISLVLAGCGSTGGVSLDDSASIAPAITKDGKQSDSAIAAVPIAPSSKETPANKSQTNEKPEGPVVAKEIVTAKTGMPPVPVKRPYRKVRKKKSVAGIAKKKSVRVSEKIALQKPASKAPDKPIVKKAIAVKAASAKPVVVGLATAKPAAAPMVPIQVIPVQIMPVAAPQDIEDAFNEAPARVKPAPEKIAKAEAVPIQHSFGQTDHRFSGQ